MMEAVKQSVFEEWGGGKQNISNSNYADLLISQDPELL